MSVLFTLIQAIELLAQNAALERALSFPLSQPIGSRQICFPRAVIYATIGQDRCSCVLTVVLIAVLLGQGVLMWRSSVVPGHTPYRSNVALWHLTACIGKELGVLPLYPAKPPEFAFQLIVVTMMVAVGLNEGVIANKVAHPHLLHDLHWEGQCRQPRLSCLPILQIEMCGALIAEFCLGS